MTKSEKFAQLLFDSSLNEEVKDFIVDNLNKFSEDEKNNIFEILENDIKNTKNILELTSIKFQNEEKKFKENSKILKEEMIKIELNNLKKLEKNKK